MSGSMSANGSLPTISRAHQTAWPSPSGSCWRVKLVWPAPGSSASRRSSSLLLPRFCRVDSSSNCLSKWSSITTSWMTGRSTTGSISLGMALVAGRNRVPRPATGKTALRIGFMLFRVRGWVEDGGLLRYRKPCRGPMVAGTAGVESGSRTKETSEMPIGSNPMRLICLALLVASLTPAAAQMPDLRSLFAPDRSTGAVPAPAPAPEWSGQPGASGHPLMTREAILAAAANFPACIEGLWPDAARRGISRVSFDQHTAGLTPDLRIMDLLDSQPEFTKTFWEYLDLL